ncbi:hypothetical protein HMPREF1990_00664, partial [Porphyromonas gingivalis W4087]
VVPFLYIELTLFKRTEKQLFSEKSCLLFWLINCFFEVLK